MKAVLETATSAARPARAPSAWVPACTRRGEPWLLGLLAASAAAALAWDGSQAAPGHAGLGLLAAVLALWAARRPAHHQAEVAGRGTLVVACALGVQSWEASLSGAVELQLWLAAACVAYAGLLRPVWAAGVVLLGLLQFLPWFTGQPAFDWMPPAVVALAAMGAAVANACVAAAELRRRPEWVDAATGLFSREGLLALGEDLAKGYRGRPTSLAVFECEDLIELRKLYGSAVARGMYRRLVRRLTWLAGSRGIVARTGYTQFAVLLPGVGRERARRAVHRVLGHPSRIEFDVQDSEIVLVPGFAIDETSHQTTDVPALYDALDGRLSRSREFEARRQRYLRRSRERYTSVPPDLDDDGPGSALASTLPMPLGASA